MFYKSYEGLPNIESGPLENEIGKEKVGTYDVSAKKYQSNKMFCSTRNYGMVISISVLLLIGTLIGATYYGMNLKNGKCDTLCDQFEMS